MGMFQNYKLTPENYIPHNIHYDKVQPAEPKYPLVAYNKLGDPVGYTWNYGDSIYLEFTTTGNVIYDAEDTPANMGFTEDAETYLSTPILNRDTNSDNYLEETNKIFQVLIYDFRYNVVAQCELPAAAKVRVLSDSFYLSSLVKGVYKLQLNLIDKNAGVHYTLIDGDECTLYIK